MSSSLAFLAEPIKVKTEIKIKGQVLETVQFSIKGLNH
jgi:hypothetical protein